MKSYQRASHFGFVGIMGLALGVAACGKKSTSSTTPGKTKGVGDAIALTGSLAVTSTSLTTDAFGLAEASGVIKCTYASVDEDKADINAGNFSLSCKAGIPAVISVFDSEGNPTCTIKFKVKTKLVGSTSIDQDVNFGALKCQDGEAEADMDVLAPESVADEKFEKDSSVSILNGESDHWNFKVSGVAQIAANGGKKGKSTAKTKAKSRSSGNSVPRTALEGDGDKGGGGGPKKDDVIQLAFYDVHSETAEKLPEGKISVGHKEDEGYEFIDNADITWNGKTFTIVLKEEKDIKEDFARREIQDQRGGGGQFKGPEAGEFKQEFKACTDPASCSFPAPGAGGPGMPGSGGPSMPQMLALMEEAPPAIMPAPDVIQPGMRFPFEAYCASTKWSAIVNSAENGAVCTELADYSKFHDFGQICTKFATVASTNSVLGQASIMQCGGFGPGVGVGSGNGGFTPAGVNATHFMCKVDRKSAFGERSPIEGFSMQIDQVQTQLVELSSMIEKAGTDTELTAMKPELEKIKTAVATEAAGLLKAYAAMEATVAEIEGGRVDFCTNGGDFNEKVNSKFSKLNPGLLQPRFEKVRKLFEEKIYRNPKMNELRQKFMSAPNRGFDGSACVFPTNAIKFISHKDLSPGGQCKITSNIELTGGFKDATNIKPLTLTFMDKMDGECALTVKRIKFNETTGCWVYGETAPEFVEEALDKAGVFEGGLQRMKVFGSAAKANDE